MAVGASLNRQWDRVRGGGMEGFPILHLCIYPPGLLSHSDGCGAAFSICHALDCKKGGLITARHNNIRDGVSDLVGKAFTPANVHDDPKIITGRDVQRGGGQRQSKRDRHVGTAAGRGG